MSMFLDHVAGGVTTVCRCWAVTRGDGVVLGFTDHDRDLAFDGVVFKADTGLSAQALEQSTGLAVDNTEAIGALSDIAIREDDIEAGRFDGAEVRAWLVNWADVAARQLQFRGQIGDLARGGGAFTAELRGLTEVLNRPVGRVYQKPCTAVLGDVSCGFDVDQPGYHLDIAVDGVEDGQRFVWGGLAGFEPGWFARGRLVVVSGGAEGLSGLIKRDAMHNDTRRIELWQPLRAPITAGDLVRLEAGCDKRTETCRFKFDNLLNFQGFPDIPGDDWSISDPSKASTLTGGSRR